MFKTLTPILSVLVAIAIFFLYVRPEFEEIRLIQDEANEYREAVAKAAEFNQLLNSLLAKRNAIGARELERLEALLPDSTNQIRAVIDIEQLAEQHEVALGSISVQLDGVVDLDVDAVGGDDIADLDRLNITRDDFETSDISFNITATYDQMKDFIQDLERSLVLMELMNLTFASQEGDLQEYNLTIRLFSVKSQL